MNSEDNQKTVDYLMWPSSLKRTGHSVVPVDLDGPLFEVLSSIPVNERYETRMARRKRLPCQLMPSAKFWNGADRLWCPVHQGNYGKPSIKKQNTSGNDDGKQCEHAEDLIDFVKASDIPVLTLVPETEPKLLQDGEYCDIGIWIGLPPSVNSVKDISFFPGIHVHARKEMKGKKEVDKNFPAVTIKDKTGRFQDIPAEGITITSPAALELLYYKEQTCPVNLRLGFKKPLPRPLVKLSNDVRCENCKNLHEDIGDIFGEILHSKHLCLHCGYDIVVDQANIGNPLAVFIRKDTRREMVENIDPHLKEVRIDTKKQKVMIWPSTPAIFWSRDKPEVWGIHVHAHDNISGERIIDDTFGRVFVDGKELDRSEMFTEMIVATEWMANMNEGIKAEELEDD